MWFGKKYEYIYNMGDDTVPAAPVTNDKPPTSSSIKDRFADIVSAVAGREIAKNVGFADPDVKGDVSINPNAVPDSFMTPETENKESPADSSEDLVQEKEESSDKKEESSDKKEESSDKKEESSDKNDDKPKEEQELSTVEKIKKGFSLAKDAYKSLRKGDFNTFVDKANELRKMSKKEFGQFIQKHNIKMDKTDQTNIFNELKQKNNIFSEIQQQKSGDKKDGDEGDDNDEDDEEGDNEEGDNEDDEEDDNNKKMKITDSYVPDKEGNLPFVISGMMNSQNKISSINYIRICKEVITGKKDKNGKPGNIKLVNGKLNADPDITDRIKFATDKCRTKGGKPNLGGKKTRRHKKIHKSKKQIKRFLRKTKQNKKSL